MVCSFVFMHNDFFWSPSCLQAVATDGNIHVIKSASFYMYSYNAEHINVQGKGERFVSEHGNYRVFLYLSEYSAEWKFEIHVNI